MSNTEPSAERQDALHAFVQRLYALADQEDRGALASLRRSLQDPSGMSAHACPHVVPFLPREPDVFRDRMYFLVAALFSLSSEHEIGVSLGDAFRLIQRAEGGENPSLRARFVAVLDAHPEDLGEHVRHAASLARAKGVSLDWERLLRDLVRARHPDRYVQRAWARDFWGHDEAGPTATPTT